jgi:hypothetical protein
LAFKILEVDDNGRTPCMIEQAIWMIMRQKDDDDDETKTKKKMVRQ